MKTIYKYKLVPGLKIEMPEHSKLLCVAFQGNDICVWAEVLPSKNTVFRHFFVFGTGHTIPGAMNLEYVGTAFLDALVFHVYENINNTQA